ncbi:hypothetical protein SLA2020_363870 [Shorea laevis]
MELGNIAEFLEDRTILVTGAAGFLAKIFLEKILRTQPNVKKLYLLLRAKDTKSATKRLQTEITGKELFRVLRDRCDSNFNPLISSKVTAVAGDISSENLGVVDMNLREEIWRETEIVVNVAATTDFYDRYDVALGINTFGALNVMNFAKKCEKIKMLLHVSTAYVCGEGVGLIQEKPFYMGETLKKPSNLDIFEEKKMMEEKLDQLQKQNLKDETVSSDMKDFGLKRAKMYGWPNTYVFTKAMGEMLLGHFRGDLPLVIIRPTMITSTYKEPFPGWIEGLRTIDSVIASYGKGKLRCFLANPKSVLDLIPADMVSNAMIVAMVAHSNRPLDLIIYQVGSSLRNPVTFSNLREFTTRYFFENPWTNRNGEPVKVGKGTVLSTMPNYLMYMTVRFLLPLKGLHLVNTICCQYYREVYTRLDQKIKLVMRLVGLYKPYAFFKGIFDDTNSQRLRVEAKERGFNMDEFGFDPKCINWEDYFMNIHIPGLVQYVMK